MTFNINDYETVEVRLAKFIAEYPDFRIYTELLESSATRFIVRASIYRTELDAQPWATGLAYEMVTDRGVNQTSALENCETSAIGRALANAGYAAKGKRPSQSEMVKVIAAEAPTKSFKDKLEQRQNMYGAAGSKSGQIETILRDSFAADGADTSSGTSLYKAIAQGIADSYGVMRFTPNRLLVATTGGYENVDFSNILGAVDGSQRPLFAAAAPQNAGGLVTQGSTAGTVAGLDLVVDPNYTGNTAGTKVALVYPSAAMRFHESGTIELRANVVANGRIEIGLYGYVCVVNRYPTRC